MTAAFEPKKRSSRPTHNQDPKRGESRPNPKGSKYARKGNGKGRRKPAPQLQRGAPVFVYLVAGTDVRATKVPCERTAEDRAERRYSQSTLGTWRDPRTNRKCKVVRLRNKPTLEVEVADGA